MLRLVVLFTFFAVLGAKKAATTPVATTTTTEAPTVAPTVSIATYGDSVKPKTEEDATDVVETVSEIAGEAAMNPDCVDDKVVKCDQYAKYCKNRRYAYLLKKYCPVTCGLCTDCFDDMERCPQWAKHGFCENPFYRDLVVKDCALTCGRC